MDKLIDALHWRYATKVFDPQKKLSDDQVQSLLQSLVLTPSSFGLQPWKFLLVSNRNLREELRKHSWNQPQITDASHLIVLCRQTRIDESFIDAFLKDAAEKRNQKLEELADYRQMMTGFLLKGPVSQELDRWAEKQVYIALGFLLSAAAILKIDTCPIEGFDKHKYDEILDLKSRGLASVVVCPAGFRDESNDKYQKLAKVRYSQEKMVEEI